MLIVSMQDGRRRWGPFHDAEVADRFATFVTEEIDPATVEAPRSIPPGKLADPVAELLAWRDVMAHGVTPADLQGDTVAAVDRERARQLISDGNRRDLKQLARELLAELETSATPDPEPVPRRRVLLRDDDAPHQIRLRLATGGSQRIAVSCTCLGQRNLYEATVLPTEDALLAHRRHLAEVGETTTERTPTA